jgi:hypothetical protein
MTTPFSLPHQAQDIADAIDHVVNADATPLSPSTRMVTSQGVKNYVDGAVSSLTADNFALATLVKEADTINSNDNDDTIPTCAAVKSHVDSSRVVANFVKSYSNINSSAHIGGFTSYGTNLGNVSASGSYITVPAGTWLVTFSGVMQNNSSARLQLDGTTIATINAVASSYTQMFSGGEYRVLAVESTASKSQNAAGKVSIVFMKL